MLVRKAPEFHEPDSKAAIIWVIGEYAEKIDKVENYVEEFG